MEKKDLASIADIEMLNASELNNIKGGANSEDSEHHDSLNNDTFKGTEEP